MKYIFTFVISLFFLAGSIFAQITTTPAFPTEDQAVTITFDATQGTGGLANYTGDVYAHTGVITDQSTSGSDWKYVIADWNVNIDKAKMTRISTNIYQLEITTRYPVILRSSPTVSKSNKWPSCFEMPTEPKKAKPQADKIYMLMCTKRLWSYRSPPLPANYFTKMKALRFPQSALQMLT